MKTPWIAFALLTLSITSVGFAQMESLELPPMPDSGSSTPAEEPQHGPAYAHPTIPPTDTTWPGAMLIIIAGMFLAAAVIGPAVRANMPDEIPPDHGHDDHHDTGGHGHHH